jgi:uncharacterized Zn-finger protein
MKFAAEYYFTLHLRSSHKETAHQCTICNKLFSGKRYLTMHMKSNHELVPTSEELKCLTCNRRYQTKKDKILHLVKVIAN